jgi:prevent-host-death family protein
MQTVGSYEAKTHLPALLERVARGEQITITRHGVPVAVLVPPTGVQKADVSNTIRDLLEFRKNHRLGGLSIRKMREEGRR